VLVVLQRREKEEEEGAGVLGRSLILSLLSSAHVVVLHKERKGTKEGAGRR